MNTLQKIFLTLITFGGIFIVFIVLKNESNSSLELSLDSPELIKSQSIFSNNLSSMNPEDYKKLEIIMPSLLVPDIVYFSENTSKKRPKLNPEFLDQLDTILSRTERESKASIYRKFKQLLISTPGLSEKFEVLLNLNQYKIFSKGCTLKVLQAYESASLPQRIDFIHKSYLEFPALAKFIERNAKKPASKQKLILLRQHLKNLLEKITADYFDYIDHTALSGLDLFVAGKVCIALGDIQRALSCYTKAVQDPTTYFEIKLTAMVDYIELSRSAQKDQKLSESYLVNIMTAAPRIQEHAFYEICKSIPDFLPMYLTFLNNTVMNNPKVDPLTLLSHIIGLEAKIKDPTRLGENLQTYLSDITQTIEKGYLTAINISKKSSTDVKLDLSMMLNFHMSPKKYINTLKKLIPIETYEKNIHTRLEAKKLMYYYFHTKNLTSALNLERTSPYITSSLRLELATKLYNETHDVKRCIKILDKINVDELETFDLIALAELKNTLSVSVDETLLEKIESSQFKNKNLILLKLFLTLRHDKKAVQYFTVFIDSLPDDEKLNPVDIARLAELNVTNLVWINLLKKDKSYYHETLDNLLRINHPAASSGVLNQNSRS